MNTTWLFDLLTFRPSLNMKSFLFVLILAAASVVAKVNVVATINKKVISIHEGLNFQITVEGTQNASAPSMRNLKGFRVQQGPSQSIQTSFVGGQASSSITYSYILAPTATGKQTIGPLDVKVGSQTYRTRPIEIEVVRGRTPAASPNAKRDSQAAPDDDIFVLLQANRTNTYVNGQVFLTLTLYYRDVDLTDVSQPNFSFDGFLVYDVGDRPVQERRILQNIVYNTVRFQKLLIPIRMGMTAIGPVPLTVTIREPVPGKRRSFFEDDFFGGSMFDDLLGRFRRINRVVQSGPMTIDVMPLPEAGRPAFYDGAVGTFKLEAKAAPATVRVGEPVTLTVELTGEGNIDSASLTLPTNTANFRVYEPETSRDSSVSSGRLVGKRTYKQAWVPVSEDASAIPAIRFSYFDVDSGKYVELKRGPFKLDVKPAPEGRELHITEMAAAGKKRGSLRILKQDIFHIKTDPGALGLGKRAYTSPLLFACVGIPPVVWLVATNIARRRRRLQTDTALCRRLNAGKHVKTRLGRARSALRHKDGREFYSELSDALCHFVADNLHVAAPQVTTAAVGDLFAATKVSPDTRDDLRQLLEECDFGRFAASAFSDKDARRQLGRAEKLLGRLSREMR